MKGLLYSLFLFCAVAWGEPPLDYRNAFPEGGSSARILQVLRDPEVAGVSWMLTESLLQFNPQIEGGAQWKIRFDADTFERLTGITPGPGYRHKRIQTSRRGGFLYLLLEAKGPDSPNQSYIFRTSDFGDSWQFTRAIRPQAKGRRGKRTKEKEVDLREVAAEEEAKSPPPAAPPNGPPGPPGRPSMATTAGQPLFRILFDLVLQIRPGANPLTFDNYHSLFLVETFPRPELQFSFEVSPSPRYYELKYRITDRFSLRGGKIWIPFDRMSPHNLFGGFTNTSLLRQPGATAFLPDIWTDLGLGLDLKVIDEAAFTLLLQLYVVNGFRDGSADPAGQVGTRYPSFENAPTLDVNGDKAGGFRLSGSVGRVFSFGGSAYTGRYTQQGDNPRRVLLLGVDAGLSPMPSTQLTVGYLFGHVGLVPGATGDHFIRGGFYAELSQRLGERWRVTLRGGASQNDNRVQDVSDQQIVGGSLSYDFGVVRLSLQHFRDLLGIPGKTVREYSALRAVALF